MSFEYMSFIVFRLLLVKVDQCRTCQGILLSSFCLLCYYFSITF